MIEKQLKKPNKLNTKDTLQNSKSDWKIKLEQCKS